MLHKLAISHVRLYLMTRVVQHVDHLVKSSLYNWHAGCTVFVSLLQIVDCAGIWWGDSRAGFSEWRLIQRQYSDHAAIAWQPHGIHISHSCRLLICSCVILVNLRKKIFYFIYCQRFSRAYYQILRLCVVFPLLSDHSSDKYVHFLVLHQNANILRCPWGHMVTILLNILLKLWAYKHSSGTVT